ncbi:response regulator receiver modulated metal dependent phosphohydrolase [Caballeronia udeis]|uniref:Response regulator receiver modulated metal dependent phosphohydrolase n=2 Tax=Caballeronia udeis TaxID=1232866 RepID=A0A158JD58_9BURK|nr:response regulator receiver modulated metal dependent phosphohydrolase [Caballeronia udeis]
MRFRRYPLSRTSSKQLKTILLVDDELSVVNAWKRILQLEGYRIVTATNGRAGLVAAREERPDLIITDRSMPIMDGVKFCIN